MRANFLQPDLAGALFKKDFMLVQVRELIQNLTIGFNLLEGDL